MSEQLQRTENGSTRRLILRALEEGKLGHVGIQAHMLVARKLGLKAQETRTGGL